MLEDGGISFKCVQSTAWRKDSECHGPSDFMTAGEHFSTAQQQIPAVPKGFVRWVQLNNINAPSERKLKKDDRKVHYIFCGDANVVPDTAGWAPFGEEFKAAMADKRGSQRISSMRQTQSAPNRLSVETCLKENPLLKSAGVTLEHFNFTFVKRSSSAKLAPSGAAAPTAVQASPVPVQPPLPSPEAAPPAVASASSLTTTIKFYWHECDACNSTRSIPESVFDEVRVPPAYTEPAEAEPLKPLPWGHWPLTRVLVSYRCCWGSAD